MGGFLGSILGGANPTLAGDINQLGQIAGFGQTVGEGRSMPVRDSFRTF